MLRKCKQCGKPLKKDKIMYGAFYCGEKCKSKFRKGWKNNKTKSA